MDPWTLFREAAEGVGSTILPYAAATAFAGVFASVAKFMRERRTSLVVLFFLQRDCHVVRFQRPPRNDSPHPALSGRPHPKGEVFYTNRR